MNEQDLQQSISKDYNFGFILNQAPKPAIFNQPWDCYVIGIFNYAFPLNTYIRLNSILGNRLVFMAIEQFNYIYIEAQNFPNGENLWYVYGYKTKKDFRNHSGLAVSSKDFEVLNKFLLANAMIRGQYDMKESVYLNEVA